MSVHFSLIVTCLKENTYMSNNAHYIKAVVNVLSPLYCQYECQKVKDCQTFNYDRSALRCDLLSATNGSWIVHSSYFSGPKICGSMNGLD